MRHAHLAKTTFTFPSSTVPTQMRHQCMKFWHSQNACASAIQDALNVVQGVLLRQIHGERRNGSKARYWLHVKRSFVSFCYTVIHIRLFDSELKFVIQIISYFHIYGSIPLASSSACVLRLCTGRIIMIITPRPSIDLSEE